MAQLKIGYILSERIRTEFEDFKEAESQLQLEYRKVQTEFDKMVLKMDSLKQDYEVKRLMALDKGESIKQELVQMEKSIQTYQAEKIGPQGELMRKQAQMEYEILGKVKKAVDKVAIDGGYDYIIDASVGLLYFKPKYDMTDDVLHELRNLKSDNRLEITLGEIASKIGGAVIGNSNHLIKGVSQIQDASSGTITFLSNPSYKKYLDTTNADAVIVEEKNFLNKKMGIVVQKFTICYG